MTRIKMLRNKLGSPNGWQTEHYQKDEEYDVPEALAKILVEDDRVAEYVTEEKAIEAAPKNKAEKVGKNKAEPEA